MNGRGMSAQEQDWLQAEHDSVKAVHGWLRLSMIGCRPHPRIGGTGVISCTTPSRMSFVWILM